MTREQAINYLISSGFSEEQVSEVVRALTYEPTTKKCTTCAYQEIDGKPHEMCKSCVCGDRYREDPTTKNGLTVDCIVDVLGSYTDLDIPYKREIAENILTKLPSIPPQEPRKGHWIKGYTFPDGEYWKCDKCNELIKVKYPMHYCNNCGSDNSEVKE